MVNALPSGWLPDRPATWTDVGMVGLGSLMAVSQLLIADSVAWGWVVGGFLVTGLAAGPVASTSSGGRFGDWFRSIGVGGRAALIVAYAVLVGAIFATVAVPLDAVAGVVAGSIVALVGYGVAHVVASDTIDGWRPQREP